MLRKFTLVYLVLLSLAVSIVAQNSSGITELKVGQKVDREISTSEIHIYKFTVTANQFVNIAVEQNGIDIALKLISPKGNVIAEYDSPTGRVGVEETKAAFEQEGEYTLEISVVERTKMTGHYALSFAEKCEATPTDFKRFQAIIAYQEGMKLRGQRTIPTLRQAVVKFDEAAKLMGELNDKKEQGIATAEKGLSQQMMGEYDNAIASYKTAISFYDEVKDYKNKGTALNNIAFIKSRLAEYQEALFYLHQALDTYRQGNNETGSVLPLINLATVYKTIGDLKRSMEYYHEALVLAKKNQMKNSETAILMNLGLIHSEIGEPQKGLELHLEILPYYKSIRDNAGETKTIGYIADEYFYLGNYNQALNYFDQQLKLSLPSNNKTDAMSAYFGLGKTYTKLNDSTQALENLNKSLTLVGEDKNSLAQILLWIAINKRNLGQLTEAKSDLEKTIEIVESIRNRLTSQDLRTAYFSKINRRIYEVYISVLMELYNQNKIPEYQIKAFEAAEKSKARSLLELLALSRVNIRQGVDAHLLEDERKLRQDLQDKAIQLSRLAAKTTEDKLKEAQISYSKAEEALQQLEAKIRLASPHYAAISQLQTVSLAETQTLLDKDTALLEFSLGDNQSFLWFITKNSMQTVELPKRAQIEAKTRQYYELLTARNLKIKFETAQEKQSRIAKADVEMAKTSNELSQVLLGSIGNSVGHKRLLIVADGALQYIPFASLRNKDRFLIETNEIVNLPSTSMLGSLRMSTRKTAPKTVVVLADPVFDTKDERFTPAQTKPGVPANPVAIRKIDFEDLTLSMKEVVEGDPNIARLPFTRKEAQTIAKFAPANQSKIALDFASTRQLALSEELNQYRIVHFATHGLLNNQNPELSGLVFSLIDENGNPVNGFLRTDEVFNMKLSADLVVLSGCKTGLGKDVRGEGLIGLTRGFMYAGAARVLVSLWDVNDEATAQLMGQFYQNLLSKKLKPAQALRQAQLWFIHHQRFANPYYAMAFTLYGEF